MKNKTISSNVACRANCAEDLFMSFRSALNKYCDECGIVSANNSAIAIIRSAAANTFYQMREVTAADRRKMHMYETHIPHMFYGLMMMPGHVTLRQHIDEMSDMSLEQLYAAVVRGNGALMAFMPLPVRQR